MTISAAGSNGFDELALCPTTTISLTGLEIPIVRYVGGMRNKSAIEKGRTDAHGFDGDPLKIHVDGKAGETGFCKWGGTYDEPTIDTFKGPDVGARIQVRTRSEDWHDLIVRKDDNDDHIFVLVVGSIPTLRIAGWTLGGEAKQERWLQRHGGREAAYFVPQSFLRDPFLLRDIMHGQKVDFKNLPELSENGSDVNARRIAANLIRVVETSGGFMRIDGPRVLVTPASAAMKLQKELVAHKTEIISLLRTRIRKNVVEMIEGGSTELLRMYQGQNDVIHEVSVARSWLLQNVANESRQGTSYE